MSAARPASNQRTALWLGGIVLGMFGFGFALVPLYGVICNALGIPTAGSATGVEQALTSQLVSDRFVTVRFTANVQTDLPWEFEAITRNVEVNPGAFEVVRFRVRNLSDETIIGQAIPSIAPWQANGYLYKAECFCFNEQPLGPGEEQELTLRFSLLPQLPKEYNDLVLSYTFMRKPDGGAG